MNRDFSDGSYMAEIIKHYLPNTHKAIIDTHNYIDTSNLTTKKGNWEFLNRKVFQKLGSASF